MKTCGQYNLYADKGTPCGGPVWEVMIQWTKADGYPADKINPSAAGAVCKNHIISFMALGRRKYFQYYIVSKEPIGMIDGPEGGKGPGKEGE